MTIVQKHIDHLTAMQNSVEDVLRDIITEHSGEIVNLVKFGQLAKGRNSSDSPLKWAEGNGFYAATTQYWAKVQGVTVPKTEGSPYNFQWSGDTFDSMGLKLTPKSYEMFTADGKQRLLEGIYGEIFQLTKANNDKVNKEILEPNLVKWIEENWFKVL